MSEFTERHIKGRPGCLNGKRIRLPMQETKEMKVRSLGRENPRKKEMVTTPVFLPRESHGQRSLVGYCPWGHKESGTLKD